MNNLKTNNYWLIPMDFSTCNYEQLQKEWKETNKIMWQVPGTPKKKMTLGKNQDLLLWSIR